ncbi:MAG: endonuclease/exonuclease/phosphatase family protein [Alistipes sp.]|nr:endonuclease/exonuclease/phosphatase family protein [Alistipes sp.]
MKQLFTVVVALLALLAADAKPAKEVPLRVGTYNVWSHSARESKILRGHHAPESRLWPVARESVVDLMVKLDCDIMGLQEVTSVCRDDIRRLLRKRGGKKYTLFWLNSYPEGHKNVVGNSILYNKKELKLISPRLFWLSPTPEVMSTGWDCKRHYRTAMAATVLHKKSGRKFFFIATHGPLKRGASANAAHVLVDIDRKYNTEGLPTIVVGDMNAWPSQPFLATMTEYYEDSFEVAKKRCGTNGTYAGAGEYVNYLPSLRRRIDHIYVHSSDKGKIEVHDYTVNKDKYEMGGRRHYPSDHNPVYVNLTIK